MRTARRFVNDESGATMALAVIMVVVLGVMGAGLLAFATKDLDTVVEENRGQAAFGVADAGIEAAKRQLKSDCIGSSTCSDHYNGGEDDLQWSATEGGLLLKDLDGDGVGGTPDNVNVKIRAIDSDSFRAVSTGTLGATTRKIEAMFEGSGGGGGGGGGNVTFPGAWTKSNILVNGPNVDLNGISMFSERNIIIAGATAQPVCETPRRGPRTCSNPWTDFLDDYDHSNDGRAFDVVSGSKDALGDWDSNYLDPSGNWNMWGRVQLKNDGTPKTVPPNMVRNGSTMFDNSGFAAEGLVCGTATPGLNPCDEPADSIADGHIAYDSTTEFKYAFDTATQAYTQRYGQQMKFARKLDADGNLDQNNPDQAHNIISYPFPIEPAPEAARLKTAALSSDSYYRGANPDWDALIGDDHVAFVDAEGNDLTYNPGSGNRAGIIVVWCGNLHITADETGHATNFDGIVVSLKGDGSLLPNDPGPPEGSGLPATNCEGDDEGTITTDHSSLKAWLYSNNTSFDNPGIQIGEETDLFFVPNGNFDLLDVLLDDPIITSIDYKGWRELYE